MKLNYRLIKISCIVMVITLCITSILTFACTQNRVIIYISNILLNIFAGAVILFITSLVEYFASRKKDLETLMKFILDYRNKFSKIKYLEEVKLLNHDEYKKKFNKDDSNVELLLKVGNECDEYNKGLIKNFDKTIDAYIDISKINFNDFWDIYADLRFIFNNKKNNLKLYNEIFKYIYDEANLIRELSYHLNIYKTSDVNPIVMYDKIRKYQNHIFYEKELMPGEKLNKKNMELIKSGISYQTTWRKDKSSFFVYNKMTKYLDEQYDNVGKIAYFNNDYKN
ncbi:MAG: hypothetical protein IJ068_04610 [Bacilli bacterium]|nr:hypothetical protein [Bacilli bacterium]